MKRIFIVLSVLILAFFSFSAPVYSLEKWDVRSEIARLASEAPTLVAFPGTPGVVWMDSDRYSLTEEGGKLHDSIFLMLLGEGNVVNEINSRKFPYPGDDGASFEITDASWYDQSDGMRVGELPRREYDQDGIKGIEVLFPNEAEGFVVAITTTEKVPGQYRLDDVIPLAGELPIWERVVEVEVPDGMNVYWEGSGVRDPERVRNGRLERITWFVLNEPAWKSSGLVDAGRPTLAFSLDHGQLSTLRSLRALENPSYAPKIPSSVSAARSNLSQAASNIAKFMSSRLIPSEAGTDTVRPVEVISPEGPWTGWEQVLIAGRWFGILGFDTDIYWCRFSGPAIMEWKGSRCRGVWRRITC